jgi:hypothetical protein
MAVYRCATLCYFDILPKGICVVIVYRSNPGCPIRRDKVRYRWWPDSHHTVLIETHHTSPKIHLQKNLKNLYVGISHLSSYSSYTCRTRGYIQKPANIYKTALWPEEHDPVFSNSRYQFIFPSSSLIQHLVLLAVHGLNILASKNGVVVDLVLLHTNVRLGVGIELGSLVCEVEVDGVRPRESD